MGYYSVPVVHTLVLPVTGPPPEIVNTVVRAAPINVSVGAPQEVAQGGGVLPSGQGVPPPSTVIRP